MSDFALVYDGFDPAQEGLREALTSTGNGYFCTRGCAEWEDPDGTHYPGTYAHGIYNRRTTVMGTHPLPNEDLVNLPNWLLLKLRIESDEPFRLADVDLLSYRHSYDVRNALVVRELTFRDRAGRETSLRSRRFVSMNRMHQAAICLGPRRRGTGPAGSRWCPRSTAGWSTRAWPATGTWRADTSTPRDPGSRASTWSR